MVVVVVVVAVVVVVEVEVELIAVVVVGSTAPYSTRHRSATHAPTST